jgi:hypothetical protein
LELVKCSESYQGHVPRKEEWKDMFQGKKGKLQGRKEGRKERRKEGKKSKKEYIFQGRLEGLYLELKTSRKEGRKEDFKDGLITRALRLVTR